MEKGRKEKYRKGKMSKIKISNAIDVTDGAHVRVRVKVEAIFIQSTFIFIASSFRHLYTFYFRYFCFRYFFFLPFSIHSSETQRKDRVDRRKKRERETITSPSIISIDG